MRPVLWRTFTVRCGPESLGSIREIGRHKFVASLQSGRQLGAVFPSRGDAAQAIDDARKKEPVCKLLASNPEGHF